MLDIFKSKNVKAQEALDLANLELSAKRNEIESLKGSIATANESYNRAIGEARKAKDDLDELKQQKKMETEIIEHNIRIKQEKDAVELESQKAALHRERDEALAAGKQACAELLANVREECATKIAANQSEYNAKVESLLNSQIKDIKETNGQILKALPNVNMHLKQNSNQS